jgi:hypothetical protein
MSQYEYQRQTRTQTVYYEPEPQPQIRCQSQPFRELVATGVPKRLAWRTELPARPSGRIPAVAQSVPP